MRVAQVVADVDLGLEGRDERRLGLPKGAEGKGREKGEGLEVAEVGDSDFVAGDESDIRGEERRGGARG